MRMAAQLCRMNSKAIRKTVVKMVDVQTNENKVSQLRKMLLCQFPPFQTDERSQNCFQLPHAPKSAGHGKCNGRPRPTGNSGDPVT